MAYPRAQAERSRDADVNMLANMPLAPVVLEEAKKLKSIDVAFTGVDNIPRGGGEAAGHRRQQRLRLYRTSTIA